MFKAFGWKTFLTIGILAGIIWASQWFLKLPLPIDQRGVDASNTVAVIAPTAQEVGEALIGGDFELIDHHGQPRKLSDFKGHYLLVYFGYSYCPDICPMGLQVITDALDLMGEKATFIQPLFITVDPQRDTPSLLKNYLENFHSRFIGLSGTEEQVQKAAQGYRVYYARVPSLKEPVNSKEYLIDHSSFIYLMDPQGKYITHFNHKTLAAEMAEKLKTLVNS